jgi:hypothetical protein
MVSAGLVKNLGSRDQDVGLRCTCATDDACHRSGDLN